MAQSFTKKSTFLFSTAGTPVATDVITTNNFILLSPKSKNIDYEDFGTGTMGNAKTVINNDYVTADFSVDINVTGSGVAGTAPSYGELLKASGLSEVVVASTSVTYTPATSFVPGTAKAYLDGAYRDVTGVASSLKLSGKVGEFAQMNFSLKGFTTLGETVGANPTVVLDANSKLLVKSATVITVGGASIALTEFTFDLGSATQEIYALGKKEFVVTDIKPTLNVKAIKTKGSATHWSELNDNTPKSAVITLGDTAGNILELTAPYCQPTDTSESDNSGYVVFDRTWNCQNNSGNDNFSIVFK